jgi:hypothetical protein
VRILAFAIVLMLVSAARGEQPAPATSPAPRVVPLPAGIQLGQDFGKAKLSDFIDLSVSGGQLSMKWVGKAEGNGHFTNDDLPGTWIVRGVGSNSTFAVKTVIWTAPQTVAGELSTISFSLLPQDRFAFSVSYGARSDRKYATLTQGMPNLRLLVSKPAAAGVQRDVLQAANIFALRDQHPAEVKVYVSDPLAKVTGRPVIVPGIVEAYRRLKAIEPDSAVTAKLQAILEKMESRLPEDRAAAKKELGELGNAGVLALVRMDSAALTPEQAGKVNEFLAGQDHGAAYAGRKDEFLLIDFLEMDDPAIRAAAQKILGVSADASAETLREAAVGK